MKSMRKNTKSFILENKTVCPCNVVKSVIFHKGGDLYEKLHNKSKESFDITRMNSRKNNPSIDKIVSLFQKEICYTPRENGEAQFLFKDLEGETKCSSKHKRIETDLTELSKIINEKEEQNDVKETEKQVNVSMIVYEKIRIKPMIKVKGVSEHKKNAVSIYTKKFSNSTPTDESKHNHKTSNINNINNITINLREKFKSAHTFIDSEPDRHPYISETVNDEDKDKEELKKEIESKNKEIAELKERLAQYQNQKENESIAIRKTNTQPRYTSINSIKQNLKNILTKYSKQNPHYSVCYTPSDNPTSNVLNDIKRLVDSI